MEADRFNIYILTAFSLTKKVEFMAEIEFDLILLTSDMWPASLVDHFNTLFRSRGQWITLNTGVNTLNMTGGCIYF